MLVSPRNKSPNAEHDAGDCKYRQHPQQKTSRHISIKGKCNRRDKRSRKNRPTPPEIKSSRCNGSCNQKTKRRTPMPRLLNLSASKTPSNAAKQSANCEHLKKCFNNAHGVMWPNV